MNSLDNFRQRLANIVYVMHGEGVHNARDKFNVNLSFEDYSKLLFLIAHSGMSVFETFPPSNGLTYLGFQVLPSRYVPDGRIQLSWKELL